MVKNEHQLQSMPWETHHHHQQQQQLDYYMNVPATSYTNVNLIINNTNRINCNGTSQAPIDPKLSPLPPGTTPQTVPSSTQKSRSTSGKNSSSPSSEFGSTTTTARHQEVYPWMNDKKHGTNKSKNALKNHSGHNTTSTSSSSSSSGKIFY
jgi:hypothetical protein